MGKINFVLNTGLVSRRISKRYFVNFPFLLLFIFFYTIYRVDELYRFLNAWVPQLYGELDEEIIKTRGFELIQHDTEWMNNRTSSKVK